MGIPTDAPSAPAVGEASIDGELPRQDSAIVVEDSASVELSSRATTMSPRPQSSATAVTSPASNSTDADTVKDVSMALDDGMSAHTTAPPRDGPSSQQGRQSPDQPLHYSREGLDACDSTNDQDIPFSPTIPNYPTLRAKPFAPSAFLRPGSQFHGTQQSERHVYEVQVEIKHVDLRESFLCGYLRIQGLTPDHPTLTTYFEGEIIGTKYNFFTNHDGWGANHKVDLNHWSKFSAFRPLQKSARKGPISIQDVAQKENIFMRWKEHFLVPDHEVRTISGASFEGFYYICFNQVKGEVSGIYFHSKSEKFQQLELKHVPDRGCFSAMEFR